MLHNVCLTYNVPFEDNIIYNGEDDDGNDYNEGGDDNDSCGNQEDDSDDDNVDENPINNTHNNLTAEAKRVRDIIKNQFIILT